MIANRPARARAIAIAIGLVSFLVLAGSLVEMARRVNAAVGSKTRHVFMPVKEQEFTFAGRDVSFAHEPDAAGGPGVIVVTYGDETLPIRVTIPPVEAKLRLPLMRAHDDWMQALRFVEGTAVELKDVDARVASGELADRLVIVTRIPPPGVDAATWGRIWRKEWSFEFYEFLPDGGFRRERLAFPTSKRYEQPKAGELVEGTWQFGAALMVMPKGTTPSPRFADDGLRAMGWTLPVATVGACGVTVALILLASSFVRRRPSAAA